MKNLQEFVSEALIQIIDGVKDAQERAANSGAMINPKELIVSEGHPLWHESGYGETGQIGQIVDFDVAVVTAEDNQIKGGVGIFVSAVGLGYQAQKAKEETGVSRIKFSVPLFLPQQNVATRQLE